MSDQKTPDFLDTQEQAQKSSNGVVFALIIWLMLTIGTLLVPPIVTTTFFGGITKADCQAMKVVGQMPTGSVTYRNGDRHVELTPASAEEIDDFCKIQIKSAKQTGGFIGWFFSIPASILLGLFVYPSFTVSPAIKKSEEDQETYDNLVDDLIENDQNSDELMLSGSDVEEFVVDHETIEVDSN